MQTSELNDLLAVVRKVRDEKHPDLDWQFLEEVVRTEEAEADNPSRALQVIGKALEQALARMAD